MAYFGIFEPLIGTGAGEWLLHQAIALCAARNVPRLIVHTCNFDHPAALGDRLTTTSKTPSSPSPAFIRTDGLAKAGGIQRSKKELSSNYPRTILGAYAPSAPRRMP